jgi:hypothetical protein
MNHYDPATDKQIKMITALLNKMNMKDPKQRKSLVVALGNNTFKVKEMTIEQANSVIWKLQYITAETFPKTIKEQS